MRRSTIAALATLAAVLLPAGGPALAEPGRPAPTVPALPSPSAASVTATPTPSPSADGAGVAAPGPVRSLAWQAVRGGARLSWQAPAQAPAGTTYTVVVHDPGAADRARTTAAPRLVLAPLEPGTRLSATVTAEADGTAGPAAEAPSWVVPAPPGAPATALLAADPHGAGLRVTWTPPTALGGGALTGFVVELRRVAAPADVAARRSAAASTRSVLFASAGVGTRYFATVAAVSAAGTGARRETPTAVLRATGSATCTACASAGGTRHSAAATAATTPSVVAPAPRSSDVAAVSRVPASSGLPWRLALGIGGIVIAACLAVAAVLLRRRSAVG